ncbi:MAG: four helix bundle protein [Planctomycetota bacterium]
MRFDVLEISLEVVRCLCHPLGRVRKSDPKLYDQIRRAASSVPLNIAEGSRRNGKDRLQLYRIAAGSAEELRTALPRNHLRGALAWGELDPPAIAEPLALLDRVLAMLWRLTH